MINNIKDKLEFEHEKYFSLVKIISRTEFYTRAFEIAAKKAIYNALSLDLNNNALSDELIEFLLQQENMIDFIYLKAGKDMILTNGELSDNTWSRLKIKIKF